METFKDVPDEIEESPERRLITKETLERIKDDLRNKKPSEKLMTLLIEAMQELPDNSDLNDLSIRSADMTAVNFQQELIAIIEFAILDYEDLGESTDLE